MVQEREVARTQFEVGGDSEVFFPPDCLGRKELFSQRAVDICSLLMLVWQDWT